MSFLEPIMESTRARIDAAKSAVSKDVLGERIAALEAPRHFASALAGEGIAIIAEIKRRSPSKGPLDEDLDAGALAGAYARAGAAAISVVTEPDHFGGSLEDLGRVSRGRLPVLRKDFIVDDFQLIESRAWGADAVLLIVRVVQHGLGPLLVSSRALGMDCLVEVHDEDELELALGAGATLLGVNHRNLETFEVDPDRTAKLAPLVPESCTLVALSGVERRSEVEALGAAGAHAVLVGEALVTAPDPEAKLRALAGTE